MNEASKNLELVTHLADLSRLELSDAEKATYAKQLNDIINYVGKISEIKTSPKPLATTISGVSNVMRADKVEQSNFADDLLACVPKTRDRMILVPKIL